MFIQRLATFFATSLQRKLMLVMTLVVTLVMIAFGFYLVNTQRQTATAELEGRATRMANLLAQTIAQPLWNVDTVSIQAQIDAVMADPDVSAVRVVETGKSEPTVQSAGENAAVNPITREAEIILLRGTEEFSLGTIEIVYSSEALNRSLAQTSILIGVIVVALILLLFISIYFLVGRLVTTPLREMTALTSRVAAGDLTGQVNLTSRDEMNILASAFNSMTAQLGQALENLEQRVKDRTADLEESNALTRKNAEELEAVSDISRLITSIQDIDDLLPIITHSISERFGFYHTGIFLLNESKNRAVLSAASSEGGQRMLKRQHSLGVEKSSLVGYAASRGQARVALNVDQDAAFLPNPDLPETKSEAALPLQAGTQIIGVLDVQSTQPNAFTGRDIAILNTLANQVAISIQNARSFSETRRALAESENIYQQFVQQGWKRISKELPNPGYRYSRDGTVPLNAPGEIASTESMSPEPGLSITNHQDQTTILSIPIKLRGQTIGTMDIRSAELSRELDEDEMAMIQATAERAALALENARLLEDSQRRASRERAIGEISSRISEKSDIDNILRSTVEELGKKLLDAEVTVEISATTEK